jgi:peroxiredoxin
MLGIGQTAPRTGDEFPDFALPDARGHYRSLSELLKAGPVVLSFNRGEWCPYCRTELEAWHCALPELDVAHGRFVAVTGEIGGRANSLGMILGDGADVLCDVDHAVAMANGLAFYLGRPMLDRYHKIGLDLATLYGSDSGFLPVPATFVIDTDRKVAFAFVDVDFRLRAEPDDVVAAVAALGR